MLNQMIDHYVSRLTWHIDSVTCEHNDIKFRLKHRVCGEYTITFDLAYERKAFASFIAGNRLTPWEGVCITEEYLNGLSGTELPSFRL